MLALLIVLPLIGAVVVGAGPERFARLQGFAWMVITLVASIVVGFSFDWGAPEQFQFAGSAAWVKSLGISLSVGVDSVALWLILLTALLGPIAAWGSFTAVVERQRLFYASLLVLQAAMIGVFSARDLILFYICFELTLAPMYVLISQYGSGDRKRAATKFFLYTFTGSIVALAGLVFVAWQQAGVTGEWTFDIATLERFAQGMTGVAQGWVLLALLAGFAVKVPLFPVHTWLPLAHTEAPTAGSVILAGVLLKLGTYGLYRFALPFVPDAVVAYAPLIAVVSIVGILYAGLICWAQTDVKKLVAYSSVSHLGFCVLGLFALNTIGAAGSVVYMVNHGLSTGALFLCIGFMYERYHTRSMEEVGGLANKMPLWSFFMVFFAMASVGLPGLNGFISEFLCMVGAFQSGATWGEGGTTGPLGPWFGGLAAAGVIIAAIYLLYMVGRVVFGPLREPRDHHEHETLPADLSLRETLTLTPLAIACLAIGVYPTPLLRSLEAPVEQVIASYEAAPARDAAGTERASIQGDEVGLIVEAEGAQR